MALTDEEKKKYRREYYLKNKAREAAKQKEYYKENKVAITAYKKKWGQDNKGSRLKSAAKWKKENRGDYLASTKFRNDKGRAELSDGYIKQVITGKSNLKYKDVPQSLIEAKRAHLQMKRLIKE